MNHAKSLFRDTDGMRYHGAAVTYAMCMYALGLYGLLSATGWVNALAVIALAHGMIIAAYMVHEAGHGTVFSNQRHNARLGTAMSWLCGASYNKFKDMQFKHFRHHVENDDIVWFDYEQFFLKHRRTYSLVRALEWLYIPAHELIMHGAMMLHSFIIPERRSQRVYNSAVIVVRLLLFVLLIWFSVKAAILYCVAYLLMLIVLRFMDSLQHDYDYTLTLFSPVRSPKRGDLAWEQAHTFSVPLSLKYPMINWLTLNFGYHNAHHARMDQPWYRLATVHDQMFGSNPDAVIPFVQQLKIYHRGRVARLVKWDDSAPDGLTPDGKDFLTAAQSAQVSGGNAASFLTAL